MIMKNDWNYIVMVMTGDALMRHRKPHGKSD